MSRANNKLLPKAGRKSSAGRASWLNRARRRIATRMSGVRLPEGRLGSVLRVVGVRLAPVAREIFQPSLLTRYLFRQNLFFVVMTMLAGTAVYLLIDLFDHVDEFVSAGVSLKIIILYFLSKIPLIISQILPATFLLSTLVQLCLMVKNREYLALQAGGISPLRLVVVVLMLGMLWSGMQLIFSQVVGIQGDRYATELWREHVEGKADKSQILNKLWFWDNSKAIYVEKINLESKRGWQVSIYTLSDDGNAVKEVVRAPHFEVQGKNWRLYDATVYNTDGYVQATHQEMDFTIKQQVKVLTALSESYNLDSLSVWQVGDMIERLKKGGSNLESLRTLWHSRLAYAASVLVMSLIAVSLMLWRDNVYLNTGVSLIVVFIFYSLFTVGITAGQKGLLPPVLATWGGPATISLLALIYIFWKTRPPWVGRVRQRAHESLAKFKLSRQGKSKS